MSKEALKEITTEELNIFVQRIKEKKKIELNYNEKVIEKIIKESYIKEYGARPIKRYIEKNIGSLIARNVVFGVVKPNNTYSIDIDPERQEFRFLTTSYLE